MWHYGVEIKCLNLRENDIDNSYKKDFIVNKDMRNAVLKQLYHLKAYKMY